MALTGALDLKSAIAQNLSRSLAALTIKIATAGLSYAMFVVLSRSMEVSAYGQFAFGFALATMLAIAAGFGQHMAILRFWPEAQGGGHMDRALAAHRAGWALTVMAGLSISLALALATWLFGLGPEGGAGTYLYGAALLILPMALAEYMSAALRAQGSVFIALTPRDIIWRSAVPVLVWLFHLAGVSFSGFAALAFVALVLALALALQFGASRRRGYVNAPGLGGFGGYWRAHRGTSLWLLAATVLDSAVLNIDVIIVGWLLSPEASGLFLNAFRTAGLMTLFLFAINQIVAPVIARHFHAGELRAAQGVAAFTVWAGFMFSLGVFTLFAIFGGQVMSLFGTTYASGAPILLVLSAGLMIDAATGPTRIVMMMTGHQRSYVAIIGATSIVALAAALAVVPVFGVMGAAVVNALTRILTQVVLVVRTRRLTGIDPSIAGLFVLGRDVRHG